MDFYKYDPDYDFVNCVTRNSPGTAIHTPDLVQAILHTFGSYSSMSTLLARRRTTVRDTVLADPDLVELRNELREGVIDRSEEVIFLDAISGDVGSAKFVVQTLGKSRGYSTRHEHTGEDGRPIRHITSDMTPEEAAAAYADTL